MNDLPEREKEIMNMKKLTVLLVAAKKQKRDLPKQQKMPKVIMQVLKSQ